MTLILKSTTTGITLSSPTYTNPIDILAGVTVTNSGDAVYAKTSAWTIANDGTVAGGGSGYGIDLRAGGTVTNAATARITGDIGVYISGAAGTVVNSGSIGGASVGIALRAGGAVTNTGTATISGNIGVYISGGAGTVINGGGIAASGTFSEGVYLSDGGSVSNASTASISGGTDGLLVKGAAGTVANNGLIAGGIGVYLATGGTLIDAGAISGGGGTAVSLGGTGSNRLVLDPGAVFVGVVTASASAADTLELASGSSAGTLSGAFGVAYQGFGTILVDAGAAWMLAAASTVTTGVSLTNNGTIGGGAGAIGANGT